MRGTLLLVVLLLGAAATHAKRASGGALEPVPTAADVRFAQQHQRQHQRVGSEAPDWWHYVAPWWSPPEHDATKAPPDFVSETNAFKHFHEPPANTMPVYVPYGRDAMSSFVETDTRVNAYGPHTAALMRQRMASEDSFMPQPQSPEQMMQQYMAQPQVQAQSRPLYAGLDTGFGPLPTAGMRYPMPRFAAAQQQQQSQQSQASGAADAGAAVAGAPPTMPSFPAVPQFDAAANEFALPAALQMSPYEEMLKRALHPEMAQRAVYGNSAGAMAPPQGSADAMRFEADAKQSEAMEDARWAQLADREFGAHARAAQTGGQVPRIWRTDRQTAGDLADERDFESAAQSASSDAELEADAQDAQEAHGFDAESDESDAAAQAADEQFAFRQQHAARTAAEAEADAAEAEADAADERDSASEVHRHESALAEAQRLRTASASQFDEEESAAAEAVEAEGAATDVSAPYRAYRFAQLGDGEAEASDSDAEADADLDAELDEEEAQEAEEAEEAEQAHEHEHEQELTEAEADAEAADSEADTAEVDALLEREADAMERASDRRMSMA